MQDKASCFPAAILAPPKNAYVIDGCAAPGNKTSQLAMGMGNGGKIIACDLDLRRLNILKRLTTKAGCTSMLRVDAVYITALCGGGNVFYRIGMLTVSMILKLKS